MNMYRILPLAFFIFILKMAFGLEPQCTPFHYQEQMIEKMIKLEIFVQKMKDDMTILQQQVIKELDSLKADNELFKYELETEKTSMKNDIHDIIKNITFVFNKLTQTNNAEMKKHAREVEAIKDSAIIPLVAFHPKDIANTTIVTGTTLIYNTIVLNEGKGYDNTTEKFTAPVGGTYLFTVQICLAGGSSNFIYFGFVVDGSDLKNGFFRDMNTYNCNTADVIVILKSGAQVWVKVSLGSGSLHKEPLAWTTYSGVLLH